MNNLIKINIDSIIKNNNNTYSFNYENTLIKCEYCGRIYNWNDFNIVDNTCPNCESKIDINLETISNALKRINIFIK